MPVDATVMITPKAIQFSDAGAIPNNPRLPVLIYKSAIKLDNDPPAAIERTFRDNQWPPQWRDGIYDFHHYHSTAHEVLGIARGRARVILGGESGEEFALEAGDVVVLPAGTGHKRIEGSDDFLVVGGYPEAQDWDLIRGDEPKKKAAAVARIARVPFPHSDPVLGADGPLIRLWKPGAQKVAD
jgi:uncharacterized protein YjlB